MRIKHHISGLYKKILTSIGVLSFFMVSVFVVYAAPGNDGLTTAVRKKTANTFSSGYAVDKNLPSINVYGGTAGTVCKKVTNNCNIAEGIFVPTKTDSEWQGTNGFINKKPDCVLIDPCLVGGGTCGSSHLVSFPSAPTSGFCNTGNRSVISGTGPWTWDCTYNSIIESCTAYKTPDPINGVCGSSSGQTLSSAPISDLCSPGGPSDVQGSGPWTWTCAGYNLGTTASCVAYKTADPVVNGVCGSSDTKILAARPSAGLCNPGAFSGKQRGENGPWTWDCLGSPLGTLGTTASCTATEGIACANIVGECKLPYSRSGSVVGDVTKTWYCHDTNSSTTAKCTLNMGCRTDDDCSSTPSTPYCSGYVASGTSSVPYKPGSYFPNSPERFFTGNAGVVNLTYEGSPYDPYVINHISKLNILNSWDGGYLNNPVVQWGTYFSALIREYRQDAIPLCNGMSCDAGQPLCYSVDSISSTSTTTYTYASHSLESSSVGKCINGQIYEPDGRRLLDPIHDSLASYNQIDKQDWCEDYAHECKSTSCKFFFTNQSNPCSSDPSGSSLICNYTAQSNSTSTKYNYNIHQCIGPDTPETMGVCVAPKGCKTNSECSSTTSRPVCSGYVAAVNRTPDLCKGYWSVASCGGHASCIGRTQSKCTTVVPGCVPSQGKKCELCTWSGPLTSCSTLSRFGCMNTSGCTLVAGQIGFSETPGQCVVSP